MRGVPSRPFDPSGATWELAAVLSGSLRPFTMDGMAEPEAHPITVAIERRIDPARTVEATSWMQAGTDLATGFAGFLGSGWVRAGEGSDLWYMLYRFRDIPTLEAWEQSRQREWWLESGRAFADEVRVERRTGIEGWFDAPFATHVESRTAGTTAAAAPTGPDPAADPRCTATVEAGGHDLARASSRRTFSPRGCWVSSRDSRSGRSCCACSSRRWRSRR